MWLFEIECLANPRQFAWGHISPGSLAGHSTSASVGTPELRSRPAFPRIYSFPSQAEGMEVPAVENGNGASQVPHDAADAVPRCHCGQVHKTRPRITPTSELTRLVEVWISPGMRGALSQWLQGDTREAMDSGEGRKSFWLHVAEAFNDPMKEFEAFSDEHTRSMHGSKLDAKLVHDRDPEYLLFACTKVVPPDEAYDAGVEAGAEGVNAEAAPASGPQGVRRLKVKKGTSAKKKARKEDTPAPKGELAKDETKYVLLERKYEDDKARKNAAFAADVLKNPSLSSHVSEAAERMLYAFFENNQPPQPAITPSSEGHPSNAASSPSATGLTDDE